MQAVILAGGQGTRLKSVTAQIPKPMVPIGGKPLLEHQLLLLKKYEITDVIILVNHLKDAITSYIKDGAAWGVSVNYYEEPEPLGTVGGIKAIENLIQKDFLVLYGDVMIDMDLHRLIRFHEDKKSDCTLVLHPNDHPYDSDLVDTDKNGKVIVFYSKPHAEDQYYRNLVNAGAYLFTKKIFYFLEEGKKADFGKDIFPKIYASINMYGYNTAEYLKDMGTPDRLEKVNADYLSGKMERKNYSHQQKAIFLDRDGVLNPDKHIIATPNDFTLYDETPEAIKKINQSEYLAIVATNQPVVARNLCTEDELHVIHNKLDILLGNEHAKLDALYYCPHHPDKGFAGENAAYKIECDCRKPKPGMLLQAAREFNIDLKESYFIGDHQRDIEAGYAAGVTTVGVMTGKGLKKSSVIPDYFFKDAQEAITFITDMPYDDTYKNVKTLFEQNSQKPYVILVGGNFRSGKSTLITYLQKSFLRDGISCMTVNLEAWFTKREDDIAPVKEVLADVLRLLQSEVITTPENHQNRKQFTHQQYKYKSEAIVFIEAPEALAYPELNKFAQLRIFKSCDVETYKTRLMNFYQWQDKESNEIEHLIKNDLIEFARLDAHQKFADIVI